MSEYSIPSELSAWTLQKIEALLHIQDIENETFDFKGQGPWGGNKVPPDLENDFCAFANSEGGTIVLGIDENKSQVHGKTPFYKNGFDIEMADKIGQAIASKAYNVDPTPTFELKRIDDGKKFYMAIKIDTEDFNKPYQVRGSCVYYIRLGSSSKPAIRSIVTNLYSKLRERVSDVQTLMISAAAAKTALLQTALAIRDNGTTTSSVIPPIDLSLFKQAVMKTEWFLQKEELYGNFFEGVRMEGMVTHLYSLETLNTYIEVFNRMTTSSSKEEIVIRIRDWEYEKTSWSEVSNYLAEVVRACDKFIKAKT
ncbi:MAG: ATP-binding protein [Nitrososphaera sp.]|jgi:hypothetical protein